MGVPEESELFLFTFLSLCRFVLCFLFNLEFGLGSRGINHAVALLSRCHYTLHPLK